MSVTLRAVAPEDAAWIDTWLPAIAASAGYEHASPSRRREADSAARGAGRRIIERAGEREGIAIFRERTPSRDAAIIELIATPPELARRGSGMQAAALLEDELRERGVVTIYAPAAARHGIAVYFWIRLGYRPLLRDEWPCEREGVAWLMRRLDR